MEQEDRMWKIIDYIFLGIICLFFMGLSFYETQQNDVLKKELSDLKVKAVDLGYAELETSGKFSWKEPKRAFDIQLPIRLKE